MIYLLLVPPYLIGVWFTWYMLHVDYMPEKWTRTQVLYAGVAAVWPLSWILLILAALLIR